MAKLYAWLCDSTVSPYLRLYNEHTSDEHIHSSIIVPNMRMPTCLTAANDHSTRR